MTTSEQLPELVPYQMSEPMRRYLYRTLDLGIVEGPIGAQQFPPDVQAVIDAAHIVLAGGEVEIKVVDEGNALVRRSLEGDLQEACEASNRLAEDAGVYVTANF